MKLLLSLSAFLLGVAAAVADEAPPKPLIEGLKNPRSVAVAFGGKVFVAVGGEKDKDGDGAVLLVEGGKAVPFATGLDDPRGLAAYQKFLFVVGRKRIWRIDETGKVELFVPPNAFPREPEFLDAVVADPESGTLYVRDLGGAKADGVIYRINPKGEPSAVVSTSSCPALTTAGSLRMDGASHLLLTGAEALYRVKLADGSVEKVLGGLGDKCYGLAWDHHGRLFLGIGDRSGGKLSVISRPGDRPVAVARDFQELADFCLDPSGKHLLVPDAKAGTLTAIPAVVPGEEVNEKPLPLETDLAFPNLEWTGWKPETDAGAPNPLRPIVLTHAGDGTNRVFVATEHGVIHVFPNDQEAAKTKIFLDLQDRVSYDDKTNEEGFLGLAFHPKYKQNGEFFVFYTIKKGKLTNVLSRFKASKDDPDKADPDSEEELLRVTRPYWNHDGGALCFGPDGYLYLTLGDGGAGNDLYDNGQSLNTLLGKVIRIDVDHKQDGKNYAIPKDNPFVARAGARKEIWAYGLRNVWRMSFDRKTGDLWAADVGQNLFEEIDLIHRGGNYGWNRREGLHPFGARGQGPREDFIEPIWEFDHDIGKSIIGGHVYRGSRLADLEGYYVYGDYVTYRIWALRYDQTKGRVVANRPIKDRGKAMFSFGEDEKGEIYLLTSAVDGKGIYWFVK